MNRLTRTAAIAVAALALGAPLVPFVTSAPAAVAQAPARVAPADLTGDWNERTGLTRHGPWARQAPPLRGVCASGGWFGPGALAQRPGRLGQQPPRSSMAMAMRASGSR